MNQQQEQKKSSSILNDVQAASSNLRIGRFLVAQGGRLAAGLLGGMGGPVLLTIGLIFLGVFVVGFAGIPGGSGGTPSPQPTQPPISQPPPGEGTPPPIPITPSPGGIAPTRSYYCQGDPTWDNRSACGIGSAGCGPTSLAMVFTSFGLTLTPPQVFSDFINNGWFSCASHMETALASSWLKNLGFTTTPVRIDSGILNLSEAKKYLDNGYLIIGSSHAYPCVSCKSDKFVDHIFVIDGVNSNTVNVRDPNNCDYNTGQEYNTNRVKSVNDFPWRYAYAIKRK